MIPMNQRQCSDCQFVIALVVALALLAAFLAFTHSSSARRPPPSPPAAVRSLVSPALVGSGIKISWGRGQAGGGRQSFA